MVRLLALFLALCMASPIAAQGLGALARVLPENSAVTQTGEAVDVALALSQPVPFRVFTLDNPARVVLDFRTVDFAGLPAEFDRAETVTQVDVGGATTPGWSRMVLTLDAPFLPMIAAMEVDDSSAAAMVRLRLDPVNAASFAADAGAPPGLDAILLPVVTEAQAPPDDGALVIMLDPGHGGVDPGALREGYSEAELILTFARELRDMLRRTGQIDVVMTRDADVFVPLPTRVTLARAADADLMISLHADALLEGRARGATVYTLAEEATDLATAALAEQHDRADLVQGIDLTGADDEVVGVLMDLVRAENAPRGDRFATALVDAIREEGLELHSRPHGQGAFSVLKAADFPSVLLEIGFLSEGGDLDNILDEAWRARMQGAITQAILSWAEAEAARDALRRQ
ncbi:N-acetylmuramoyl-L-alanine amidase [Gymnodinialimonas sp. 2305UL16-5]|uniref:N-acetylmuramoyl-L-alanine amidase n=1 Tax=Gymnodinialimonas mytili TaxID=3126503 RepID=UPI0030A812C3